MKKYCAVISLCWRSKAQSRARSAVACTVGTKGATCPTLLLPKVTAADRTHLFVLMAPTDHAGIAGNTTASDVVARTAHRAPVSTVRRRRRQDLYRFYPRAKARLLPRNNHLGNTTRPRPGSPVYQEKQDTIISGSRRFSNTAGVQYQTRQTIGEGGRGIIFQ